MTKQQQTGFDMNILIKFIRRYRRNINKKSQDTKDEIIKQDSIQDMKDEINQNSQNMERKLKKYTRGIEENINQKFQENNKKMEETHTIVEVIRI